MNQEQVKLAEALVDRKNHKTKLESLKQRLYRNVRVQDGEIPTEDPSALLEQLAREIEAFVSIVTAINLANTRTRLPDGRTLTEALIRRDMLRYVHIVHTNMADKAMAPVDRYSRREIRMVPTVDVTTLRSQADEFAKTHRMLDLAIQAKNWEAVL